MELLFFVKERQAWKQSCFFMEESLIDYRFCLEKGMGGIFFCGERVDGIRFFSWRTAWLESCVFFEKGMHGILLCGERVDEILFFMGRSMDGFLFVFWRSMDGTLFC